MVQLATFGLRKKTYFYKYIYSKGQEVPTVAAISRVAGSDPAQASQTTLSKSNRL